MRLRERIRAWLALRWHAADRCRRANAKQSERPATALGAAELERLATLAEECGEAVQAAAKIVRFGWESRSPFGGAPNRQALEREIGHVLAAVRLMYDAGEVRWNEVSAWRNKKLATGAQWRRQETAGGGGKRDE